MSHTPNYDAKIKIILDSLQPGERTCALTGEKWLMTDEEISWYKKFNVPPPGHSPAASWLYLAHFSTGYQWWWNKHFDTGEPVLTFIHPASGLKVLPDKEWFARDFSKTTQEYKPERSFFEQFKELQIKIPLAAFSTAVPAENSIALVSFGDQNSYFVLASKSKNSYFCDLAKDVEDCSDCVACSSLTSCHNVIQSERLHNCQFVRDSFDCLNSAFLFDCRNCEYCFGATNQRNKKYLWFNEQLDQKEYEQRRASVDLGCRSEQEKYLKKFEELLLSDILWPENFNIGGQNSSGDYLHDCVDCKNCFSLLSPGRGNYWCGYAPGTSENCALCWGLSGSSDCYFSLTPSKGHNCKFVWRCMGCDDCEYSASCYNCQNCFGCVGLQYKSFCIFNQQYSEEDYWQKLDEIKTNMLSRGEYGKFFPFVMATGCPEYGGLVGYTDYSLSDVTKFGGKIFPACSEGACGFEVSKEREKISVEVLPDSIDDYDDSWCNFSIEDKELGRYFSYFKPELAHYRKNRIAPPNRHFIFRTFEYFRTMQLAQFEKRECFECHQEILATVNVRYRQRKIFCKKCYIKLIEENN